MTSSPFVPLSSAGHPGSGSGTGAGGGTASVAHADWGDACQLHHDSPALP